MIAVVQRVTRAEVRIAERDPTRIGPGLLILLGVARDDGAEDARWLAQKCMSLRIFSDARGHMNLGLADTGGELLVVSQFTLLGDCVKGRRPSWSAAAEPPAAERLYETFVAELRRGPFTVATGVFQARMAVESVNDGPVTLIVDSRRWRGTSGDASADADAARSDPGDVAVGAVTAPACEERPREPVRDGTGLLRRESGPLFLASRSPRRVRLLEMLGVPFTVRFPGEDGGARRAAECPADYAERQARRKALAIAARVASGVVLGADTVVHVDGRVLEKPADANEAAAHLRLLAGREHEVFTGICLARAGGEPAISGVERSRVRMVALDEEAIAAYVATGEPLDKAGAYGIQGIGGMLIAAIDGCYFNVMGLPLARLRALFAELEGRPR